MKKRVFTRAPQDPEWLDALVSTRLALPIVAAQQLITLGAVHVNGQRKTEVLQVPVGAKLIVFHDPRAHVIDPPVPLELVLHDRWIAVVDKPAGLPTQAERAQSEHTLEAQVQRQVHRDARLLHRLDKEASGLVLFTVHKDARAPMQKALEDGRIERRYIAIVDGELDVEGTIDLRIGRHALDERQRAAFPVGSPAGQAARTHYRRLARHGNFTAVEVRIDTGRTHQIRVHLSAIGHPLVGDGMYDGPPHERLCLHAYALRFPHPHSGEPVEASSLLPPTFAELVPSLTSPFT